MPGARCSAISTTFATQPRHEAGERGGSQRIAGEKQRHGLLGTAGAQLVCGGPSGGGGGSGRSAGRAAGVHMAGSLDAGGGYDQPKAPQPPQLAGLFYVR
ncbi:hypothetical protein [Paracoccus rhizosphaerae]|uniref:hypothetical protein n=1 Tax=Paracoccus rhizosphaerae TaxID=1133347 RepID=UPI00223FA4BC|nr:hypothetical protein [Paracoccus rhizosphaerae]